MSANPSKLTLTQAEKLAEKIVLALHPGCQRLEIAGSIRRRKAEIGDLELVCLAGPKLDEVITDLVEAGRLIRGNKNGPKYKNFLIPAVPGLKLDLFIPTVQTWGVIFTLRTGSQEFSQRLVTQQNKGGFLPDDLRVADGRVWRDNVVLPTPEETDIFDLLGWYVEPECRTADFRMMTPYRRTMMQRIGQGHLEPGMSVTKLTAILTKAGIASLDIASDEELDQIWQRIKAA